MNTICKSVSLYFLILCSLFLFGNAVVIDRITGHPVTKSWLSFGSAVLNTEYWISLESQGNFKASDSNSTVVLTSLPDVDGSLATDGVPITTRIRNIRRVYETGKVTFEAKMFVPNDTFCATTWYTPSHVYDKELSFIVADKGVFLMDDIYMFVVSTGQLNRTTAVMSDPINIFTLNFPKGCDGTYDVSCSFNTTQSVDTIGVIATIQSLVHNTYLLLRVQAAEHTRIRIILTPHDSVDEGYYSSFGASEIAGYMVFKTGFALSCTEGVQFETHSAASITSTGLDFSYLSTYQQPPAAFGMLVTTNSPIDSTTLRVYNRTALSYGAVAQEDQCADQEMVLTTPERAAIFLLSPVAPGSGTQCSFSDAPVMSSSTLAPTLQPTPTPTVSPTVLPTESCNVPVARLGDGRCHTGAANTVECMWDYGDCCEQSCLSNPDPFAQSRCGDFGYDCKDPDQLFPTSVPTTVDDAVLRSYALVDTASGDTIYVHYGYDKIRGIYQPYTAVSKAWHLGIPNTYQNSTVAVYGKTMDRSSPAPVPDGWQFQNGLDTPGLTSFYTWIVHRRARTVVGVIFTGGDGTSFIYERDTLSRWHLSKSISDLRSTYIDGLSDITYYVSVA